MGARRVFMSMVAAILVAGACSDDDGAATTTSSSTSPTVATTAVPTTVAPSSTVTAATATTTTVAETTGLPPYQIVVRRQGTTGGDTVVVVVEPGVYTDLDLENVVADVVTRFAPIATLHLVDDAQAAAMVLAEGERPTDERVFLASHYLLVLEDGFRITYLGPYAEFGETVLVS